MSEPHRVVVDLVDRQPGRATLVAFPSAGAGVSLFDGWASALAPALNFAVVRLPGREALWLEEPISDLSKILSMVGDELADRGDEELLLYGSCTGGLLAYELAHQLRRDGGAPVSAVVMASTATPDVMAEAPMHALPDSDLRKYFEQGEPEEYPDELWEFAEPRIRADLRAAEHSDYTLTPLDVPLVVLRGVDDGLLGRDFLQGWARFTRAEFVFTEYPGSHFFMSTAAERLAGEMIGIQRRFGSRS